MACMFVVTKRYYRRENPHRVPREPVWNATKLAFLR